MDQDLPWSSGGVELALCLIRLFGFINVPLVESQAGLKPCGFEAWFWSRRCGYVVGLASRGAWEMGNARSNYTITFSRREADNATKGFAVVNADTPGGRVEDAERLAAVIKALTGRAPRVRCMKDGTIIIE